MRRDAPVASISRGNGYFLRLSAANFSAEPYQKARTNSAKRPCRWR